MENNINNNDRYDRNDLSNTPEDENSISDLNIDSSEDTVQDVTSDIASDISAADDPISQVSQDADNMTVTDSTESSEKVDDVADSVDSEIPQDKPSWSDPAYTEVQDNMVYSPNYYGEKNGYSSYQAPKSHGPEKKTGITKKAVAFVLVCALVCSLFSGVSALLVVNYKINSMGLNRQVVLGSTLTNDGTTNTETDQVEYTGEKLTGSQIYYNLAVNQVVGVNSESTTNVFGQPSSSAVSGSGFVISEDGYILTNYHVIEYAAQYGYNLTVMFNDGKEYDATIVGYDESNDVAVIKIDATGLSPVTFGDSDSLKVGESIYVVGNPLGELSYSMSSGIVSATNRTIATDASTQINMFQLTAAVNNGNSGGPVYNEYGEVVGIVTAKYSEEGVEGLGFAIPINDVLDIVTQLIENGYISGQAKLGITVQTMDSSYASYYNVPEGAYVREVESGSCAEKAGIKVGDIITAIDNQEVSSKEDLISMLRNYSAGDTVTITIHRAGQTQQLSVTLDEKLPTETNG